MSLRSVVVFCVLSAIAVLSCQRQPETAETQVSSKNVALQSQCAPECYRFDLKLSEARIVAGPPEDNSTFRQRFDFKSSGTPWTVAEGNARCAVADKAMKIEADTLTCCDSPVMTGLPSSLVMSILIEARVSGCDKFTLAWRREGGEFSAKNEVSIDVIQSGAWTVYTVDTSVLEAWRTLLENVAQLRLILPAQAKIEVRSIDLAEKIDPFAGRSYGQIDYPYKRNYLHSIFLQTPCSLEYDVTVMPDARLAAGLLRSGPAAVQFRFLLDDGAGQTVLAEKRVEGANSLQKAAIDLSRWAGRKVKIRFEAESQKRGTIALLCSPAMTRGYPVTATKRPINVIWYVIDCLRATNVSCYGHERETTPTLDAVAREGVRFEWCFSPGTWTVDSVSSFFTGLSPNAHGMMRIRTSLHESMRTLSEDLRSAGYSTALFSTNPYIGEPMGFVRGFDEAHRFRVRGAPKKMGKTAEDYPINAAIGKFLDENKENPFFIYIHTIEPHGPYVPPVRLMVFHHPDGSTGETDMYDDCVLWADTNLESIIGRLKEDGLWNNTLLIISADHGQCFSEYDNGLDGHGKEPYLSRVRIPLVMRLPGTIPQGVVIQENVQELDVPRTLFELLQIQPDPQFDGWSLLGLLNGSRKSEFAKRMLFPSGQKRIWQAVVDGKWYFHDNDGKLELYDLASDPTAKKDLSAEHKDIAQAMLSESRKYREAEIEKGKAYPPERNAAKITEEDREELRALGYVE